MAGPTVTAAWAALAVLAALVAARLQASVARLDAIAARASALAMTGAESSGSLQREFRDRPQECRLDDLYQRCDLIRALPIAERSSQS